MLILLLFCIRIELEHRRSKRYILQYTVRHGIHSDANFWDFFFWFDIFTKFMSHLVFHSVLRSTGAMISTFILTFNNHQNIIHFHPNHGSCRSPCTMYHVLCRAERFCELKYKLRMPMTNVTATVSSETF